MWGFILIPLRSDLPQLINAEKGLKIPRLCHFKTYCEIP